jgi:eukaryotic-like serine/threonine-protein kinase
MGDGGKDATLLTAPDSTTGTPAYIAPELVRGDGAVDHRVDIYALGCVGYWLLTGRLVFEAPNAIQMMYQHANAEPVPPSRRSELDISPELDSVILACLAKHPDDRPHSAGELSRRLAAAAPGEVWTEERAHRWWDRHHPEAGKPEPTSEHRRLTKTTDLGWMPEPTPEPGLDPARSI